VRRLWVLIAGALVAALVAASCSPSAEEAPDRIKVVTSTSLLTYIVEQVGGDLVDVYNVVPPAQHPGDFDARPSDIQRLAEADLFLLHGWPGETFAAGLIESAGNDDLKVVRIEIPGNWMTPPVQMQAADAVAAALGDIDAANSDGYISDAGVYKQTVASVGNDLLSRVEDIEPSDLSVISEFFLSGFARWLGFQVAATHGGPQPLTPGSIRQLVDDGNAAGVVLVIDNLHNGRDAGKGIAEELGAARVSLSYFPGGHTDAATWEAEAAHNVDLILEALSR
jgi:zinc transport system substrate-binding protein